MRKRRLIFVFLAAQGLVAAVAGFLALAGHFSATLAFVLLAILGASVVVATVSEALKYYVAGLREKVGQQAASLRAIEERFRDTLEALEEGFQIIGRDWRYVYLNPKAAQHARRPREELLGKTIFECYPGFDKTIQFQAMAACMSDRTPRYLEEEFVYPDGSRAYFALGIHPAPEGIAITSLDITERKSSEARIARLCSVLNAVRSLGSLIIRESDARALLQKACVHLVENKGYEQVFVFLGDGDRVGELCGVGARDAAARASFETLVSNGFIPKCVYEMLGKPGVDVRSHICSECPNANLIDAGGAICSRLEYRGRVYGILVAHFPRGYTVLAEEASLFSDYAEDLAFALYRLDLEKRHMTMEQQYETAQRLESIGRLAGGVAHDYNNLLSIILTYAEFVLEQTPEGDPRREDVLEIRKAADRAISLTRQLLAFSRKQVMKIEVIDLNEVVKGIDKIIRRVIGEDIEIRTKLAPDLWPILADRGQMEQVLMNLVVNARDAMPQGGILSIETANVVLDDEYARQHFGARPGPHVVLSVSDTGCGMDEETKKHIFEPFFTTKKVGEGTGLGLSTVYGIVKQSGGNIWVYSELGKGTTFEIYLPKAEGTTPSDAQSQIVFVPPERVSGTILLVEDEEPVRNAAARILREAGFTVVAAANGREAMAISQGLKIDLVLTDVVMPEMGGKELVTKLREKGVAVKAIFMSGYADKSAENKGILDSDTEFIEKPFTAETLVRKVMEVIGRK